MRKLPFYILVDTSGSMKGEPITAVNTGLGSLLQALRDDPNAMDSVHLSILTFDREVKTVVPLTPFDELVQRGLPILSTPESGPTHMGEALLEMCNAVDREVVKGNSQQKGDWLPIVLVLTDGHPSDTQAFNNAVAEIKRRRFARIIGCAAGPNAKREPLHQFCSDVWLLETTDPAAFASFFIYSSDLIRASSRSSGLSQELPKPPERIQISNE